MHRKLLGVAVLGLLFCAGAALAGEHKGKITKVDEANSKITLNEDGKETEFAVAADCKFPKLQARGKATDKERAFDLKAMAKRLENPKDKGKDKEKAGIPVVVTTTKKDDKDVVTEIKFEMRKGKAKEKKEKVAS